MFDRQQYAYAFDKIYGDIPKLCSMAAPFNQEGILFGYASVFDDGHYYFLDQNPDLVEEFVKTIRCGRVFCGCDITVDFDKPYHCALWSEIPSDPNTAFYFNRGFRNGMTIYRIFDDRVELWAFFTADGSQKMREKFIIDKYLFLEQVHCFNRNRAGFYIPSKCESNKLFTLPEGFYVPNKREGGKLVPFSKDLDRSLLEHRDEFAQRVLKNIREAGACISVNDAKVEITPEECLIAAVLSTEPTTKDAARILPYTPETLRMYVKNIAAKLGGNCRSNIFDFSKKYKLQIYSR